LKRLIHLLCALVLCLQLCGGHLGMIQVVAWSSMMLDFARTDGVVEAARKTFDGAHKCTLCHAIDASRDVEQKQGGSKLPAPEWSKFGKELVSIDDVSVPVRHDRISRRPILTEPGWLWPADPAGPPIPPPRTA